MGADTYLLGSKWVSEIKQSNLGILANLVVVMMAHAKKCISIPLSKVCAKISTWGKYLAS